MNDELLIDKSVAVVEEAAARVGRHRLAKAADLRKSTIRAVGTPDWNPTAETLRKLERVAPSVLAEDGEGEGELHRESEAPNPIAEEAA